MNNLIHLIYCSAASHALSTEELQNIINVARRKNEKVDITGILLYSDKSFFQVLEGKEKDVNQLFDLISRDSRHLQITTIIKEKIPKREFAEWTMGFYHPDLEALQSIDGFNDFFTSRTCLADLDRGRAKKLLQAFAQGRWRKSLE